MIYQSLIEKHGSLAVIGLGYVGLPLALAFAKYVNVVGFDINQKRIKSLQDGYDPSGEQEIDKEVSNSLTFTHEAKLLANVNFFIIAVPTPIDEYNQPDLKALMSATEMVASNLKKGDYVVFESTVYPGCTEEKCIPLLEKISGLKHITDFKSGYSPERINPGDKVHTLHNVVKVVSGCDEDALAQIGKVYELVVNAGVHRASSIKVAEAAKVIENTQRDLNIALMNELSMIFDKLHINTYEVLEAAGTKWNFLKFYPGLVGGHCIGVDPYYLTFKANHMGHFPKVILSGREINDGMGPYIAKRTIQLMISNNIEILKSKVLVLGATFKENVKDIRNSKVVDLIQELKAYHIEVDIVDAMADPHEFWEEYGLSLQAEPDKGYSAVILAVAHSQYIGLDEAYFANITLEKSILIDVKGIYRGKIKKLTYWSL
ncbi:MAG: nucleotide sugar dehydrogenase [Cytophagales bacterium]|nr:nucleotide sugar dehydrogenase [Cytophagales bacterium]